MVGGRTILDASPGAVANLAERGVSATGARGAQLTSRGIRFRISGGDLGTGPLGAVRHAGALALTRDDRRIEFRRPVLRLGSAEALVTATVAGSEVRLFNGDLSDAVPLAGSDSPYGVKRIRLRLAAEGADAMSAGLGVPFAMGDPVGRLNVKPFVETDEEDQ